MEAVFTLWALNLRTQTWQALCALDADQALALTDLSSTKGVKFQVLPAGQEPATEEEVWSVEGRGPEGQWIELAKDKTEKAARLLRARLEMTMVGEPEPCEFRVREVSLQEWCARIEHSTKNG